MNLVIDYGNSTAKIGMFEHQNLVQKNTLSSAEELRLFLRNTTAENVLVSSVSAQAEQVASWASPSGKKMILNSALPVPVISRYATPATLGVDRLAGVCGAQESFPHEPCLVIDAGTCITYDFIDRDKIYHGGAIAPGLEMRFKAVHTFTAKLPLVSPTRNPPLIGNSTESCIQSGIIHGMIAEMDGIIQQYIKKFDGLRVILCGGDTAFFENQLKASIFASPELVLIGLNSILNYNVNR
jgi:type III pantothenate kinase